MDKVIGRMMEGVLDVDETVFVAVGMDVESSKKLVFWAVQNFSGKSIWLLHVHKPHCVLLPSTDTDGNLDAAEMDGDPDVELREVERKRMHDVLNEYSHILIDEGVQVGKLWIEMDNIEKAIVEMIAKNDIKWLVMGAAADRYYTKKLTGLKSKKATYVCQHAPSSCHIWFLCEGHLIFTREGKNDQSEIEVVHPLPMLSFKNIEQPEELSSEFTTPICDDIDAEEEDGNELDGLIDHLNHQLELHSSESPEKVLSSYGSISLLTYEDGEVQEQTTDKELGKMIAYTKSSKKKTLEDAMKLWEDEDSAVVAKCKAKALENLCVKEMSLRKKMEEALARQKQEVERMKNQFDEVMKELLTVQEQKSSLDLRMEESLSMVRELEEKIISAVELLISFKEKRDAARKEYENALDEVKRLKYLGSESFCQSKILEFSFKEINEATNNFDPSWKIGEGRFGSVYKGLLRHIHVSIKMLPFYGSKSQLEFQNGVEVLSRVRHPNLAILIGVCPEIHSLVYEFVGNGSLEDWMTCRVKRPFPWHVRLRVATEMCIALIFLHSNKPCLIHGNLKPSNVLLDTSFVCKLGDYGIFHLIPKGDEVEKTSLKHNSSTNSLYTDPEYIETGKPTLESDVYSFGMIMLQLLSGRSDSAIVTNVKCALECGNLETLLDPTADWPLEEAELLAHLALRCCEKKRLNRPDLVSEIWSMLQPMRASLGDSASSSRSKEQRRTPSHFLCPIFQEVMKDPQIAADGFTYEAEAIEGWINSGHDTSPMTNLKMDNCKLLPNHALHQAILEWQQQW